jgi:hypothetical protein
LAFLKKVASYRLRLKSDRSGLSTYATNFDLVNDCEKSRCVAIGSLGFDLVDQIGAAWRKPIRLLSAFGALTYFDYRRNQVGGYLTTLESNL